MNNRPTLAELRARVFKHSAHDPHRRASHVEIGNWLARRVARPTAVYGTWLAVRLGLSAHQVTSLALIAYGASAMAIASGTRAGFVAGTVLAVVAYWLDHVDGQVARWRRTASLDGVYFDYLMHHGANLALGFALGYGLSAHSGDVRWAGLGFLVGGGWAFLGLQNECRYKALFQRLKADRRSFRVDGDAGGRPSPPAPWPRRGFGIFTWPAFKACEPHVILVELAVLSALALLVPPVWRAAWRAGIVAMAILAPGLAIGRAARTIRRGSVEAEFARWFQPWDDDRPDNSGSAVGDTGLSRGRGSSPGSRSCRESYLS